MHTENWKIKNNKHLKDITWSCWVLQSLLLYIFPSCGFLCWPLFSERRILSDDAPAMYFSEDSYLSWKVILCLYLFSRMVVNFPLKFMTNILSDSWPFSTVFFGFLLMECTLIQSFSPQESGVYVAKEGKRLKKPEIVDDYKKPLSSKNNGGDLHMWSPRMVIYLIPA